VLDLPEGVPPLTTFYLYLTSGCNLRCRHCWITPRFVDGEPSPGEVLSPELLRSAIEQARPLGLSQAKLTGGEPLLHPRFVEIVDLLTEEGIRSHMETNGTLIDADLARHLREETSLWFVSVSIDGPTAEIHDPFRGVEGSFDAAVEGFRHLVEVGYRPQLIMSPHRGNVAYLEEVVELGLELGAGSVKFNPVTRSGRGIAMHERDQALDVAEILELAHFVRGELQKRTPIRLLLGTPPALYTVAELVNSDPSRECHVRHILGILGSGDTAICGIGQTVPELCFGNLADTKVRDIWLHHPVLQQLREDLEGEYPGLCGECIHAHRCLTHCVAQNYVDSGRLVTPHTLCAAAYERGLFPASRLRDSEAA
jgi:SynChlorMet cassette radical SAM/SPASM protein ScmF